MALCGLLLTADARAAYDVSVVSGASSGGAWVGDTWTPSANASTVNASEVEARLDDGPVTISTAGAGSEDGSIVVSAALTWEANVLTLRADHDITIDAALSGGTALNGATLALEYGQGSATGDTATYRINTFASLRSYPGDISDPGDPNDSPSFSTRRGSAGLTDARPVPNCGRGGCSFLRDADFSVPLDIQYGTMHLDATVDTELWMHVSGGNLLGMDLFPGADDYYPFAMGCDPAQGETIFPTGSSQAIHFDGTGTITDFERLNLTTTSTVECKPFDQASPIYLFPSSVDVDDKGYYVKFLPDAGETGTAYQIVTILFNTQPTANTGYVVVDYIIDVLPGAVPVTQFTIADGEVRSTQQILNDNGTGLIEAGGELNTTDVAAIFAPGHDVTITNDGSISTTGPHGSFGESIQIKPGSGISSTGHNAAITNNGSIVSNDYRALQVFGNNSTVTNNGSIVQPDNGREAIFFDGTGGILINSGTIAAETDAETAIAGGDGANTLVLQPGSSITGLVDFAGGADVFELGGSGTASLDAALIGVQYLNFDTFRKAGTAEWTLSGSNATALPWTVGGGTLVVNGTLANSTLTVNAGGTLGGSGSVGAVTVNGGAITPGISPDTLNTGTLVLNGASALDFELDTPGVVGGGVNDLIAVTGDLTLDGTLSITDLGGFGAGSYTLITYTGTLTDNDLNLPTPAAGLSYSLTAGGGQVILDVQVVTYNLSYAAGANGSLTGTTAQTVTHGNDATAVTAVPDAGFLFQAWSDGSTVSARVDTDITADLAVTALFVAAPVEPPVEIPAEPQPISSHVINAGTLIDPVIGPDGILEEGTLAGTITNAGEIRNVSLSGDAVIEGGRVSGTITGSADNPARINAEITAGTVLRHVRIGANALIHPDAVLGEGVCFESTTVIPSGLNLSGMMPAVPWAGNLEVDGLDLNRSLSCEGGETVLATLETLLQTIDPAAIFIQDMNSSLEVLLSGGVRGHLLLARIAQTDNLVPGYAFDENGDLLFITPAGQSITAYPVPGDLAALQDALAVLTTALSFDDRGIAWIRDGTAVFRGRPEVLALPVPAATPLGLRLVDSMLLANVPEASLVYDAPDGTRREQRLAPWPADWSALAQALLSLPGAEDADIGGDGLITVHLDGGVVSGMADYLVTPGMVNPGDGDPPAGPVLFEPAGDLNGDGSIDVLMHFPNGDTQRLYVLPTP
ncbi:MAG: hypothetical protein WDZ76_04430 [Pseudohongiellaceae bacterium]